MKNVIVANLQPNGKNNFNQLTTMIQAQLDNSLSLNWAPEDLVLITNFNFQYRGVSAIAAPLNEFCLTGSKIFALKWLLDSNILAKDEVVFMHDLDAWQNVEFECPEFEDAGACYYSRPKFNGGVNFWKLSAKDIVNEIVDRIKTNKSEKEEPAIDAVFKSKKFKDRVTVLDYGFNLGCSGYVVRYTKAEKPIKMLHFHPTNRIAVETHLLDRNGLDEFACTSRLEKILRKYYPHFATELSADGKQAQTERRANRLANS